MLIFPPGTPQRFISRLEEERKMKSQSSGVHISGFFVSDVPAFQKTLEKPVEDIVNHGLVSNSGDFIISNGSTPSPSQSMVSSASQIDKHNGNRMTAREIYEGQRDENDRPAGGSIAQTQHYPEQGAKSCTATLKILGTEASDKASRNPLRNVPAIQKKLEERKSVNEIKKEDPIGGQDQGSVSSSSQVNEHNGKPITAREVYEGQRDENTRPAGISIAQTQQPVSNSGDFIIVNSPTSSRSSSNSTGQQPAAPGFLSSVTGERILEEILREICSLVRDPQEIDVQRTPSTGHLQFKFKINETQIEVQFLKTFPEDPAKILVTSPKKPYQFDAKPKKNEEFNTSKNILIAIRSFSDLFNPQQSTAPAFVQAVGTFFSKVAQVVSGNHDDPKETTFLEFSNELCVKIADEFSIASVVNVQIKKDKPGERVELTFEHNKKQYVIAIPVEFPGKSARIYNLVCDKKYVAAPKDGQNINNFHKILNAVKHECSCVPCRRCRFEQE